MSRVSEMSSGNAGFNMRHRWTFRGLTDEQRARCARVSQEIGIPVDAVLLVFVALDRLMKNREGTTTVAAEPAQVSAQELCGYLAQYAAELTRDRGVALDAFFTWGLRQGEHVAPIVKALAGAGLVGPQSPRDSESFRGLPLVKSLAQEPGEWPLAPAPTRVRIVRAPPGEAPEAVRQSWVGLVLPLAAGESGSRYLWVNPVRSDTSRPRLQKGYVVQGKIAVEILGQSAPAAASWWQQHTPQLLQGQYRLVFPADICQAEE
jgi:hypothetical protein